MIKVGDLVRVLTDYPQESYFEAGDTFIVEYIDGNEINGKLPGRSINFVYMEDVELVKPFELKSHMPEWF